MRILLVDNDLIFLEFASRFLESLGHEVDTAKDGLSALDRLQTSAYEVLVTDLIMPNIDGGTLVRLVRLDPALKDMRVVVVSAVAKEDTASLYSLRADFCIGKGPFADMRPHLRQAVSEPLDGHPDRPPVLGVEALHHRNVTSELLGQLRQFEALLHSTRDGVLLMTVGREITQVNEAAEGFLGIPSEQALGKRLDQVIEEVAPTLEDEEIALDRGELKLELSLHPIMEDGRKTGEIAFIRDVSQYYLDQRMIQEQLERQTFLLREIHHRVKNNLATVANYIALELDATKTEDGRTALQGVAAHVDAVMLAHQQLYHAANAAGAPVGEYLKRLSNNLLDIFGRRHDVTLQTEIDDVVFGLETSVPLGLTVAEIVTNSLKHGLGASAGVLRVELTADQGTYRLLVRDNGPGFPAEIVAGSRESLGLTLIEGLSRQISGSARFYNDGGAVCEVTFSQ
jgi:two-component sensor histidine kinase